MHGSKVVVDATLGSIEYDYEILPVKGSLVLTLEIWFDHLIYPSRAGRYTRSLGSLMASSKIAPMSQ